MFKISKQKKMTQELRDYTEPGWRLDNRIVVFSNSMGDITALNAYDGSFLWQTPTQNNKIYAAGLDVFNNEPNLDERYMKLDNCFVLPHVGSATHETRLAMSMMAVDNICNYFENKPLISEVV